MAQLRPRRQIRGNILLLFLILLAYSDGRFGGRSPPRCIWFCAWFGRLCRPNQAQKRNVSGACGPAPPPGEFAISIICIDLAYLVGRGGDAGYPLGVGTPPPPHPHLWGGLEEPGYPLGAPSRPPQKECSVSIITLDKRPFSMYSCINQILYRAFFAQYIY